MSHVKNEGVLDSPFEYQFRLILIGDSTVGKSSLLRFFIDGIHAQETEPTVGVDFYVRVLEVYPGVRVKLQLWDTAGQEKFRSITRSYYRNSVGALLLYDITCYASFEHAAQWLEEARKNMVESSVFLVVGCKCDKEPDREVSPDDGRLFADAHGLSFLETSAKTGESVELAFLTVARDVYDSLKAGQFRSMESDWEGIKQGLLRPPSDVTTQDQEVRDNRKKCCSS